MVKKMQESVVTQKESNVSPSILVQEYNSLVNLYTHAENTLFSIFNFYVTLLTTITGAIVVVFQLSEKNMNNPFGTILVLLVFIVLIGIITQDALIHKNGDLAHFALAINSIKSYLLKNHPRAKSYVFICGIFMFESTPYNTKLLWMSELTNIFGGCCPLACSNYL